MPIPHQRPGPSSRALSTVIPPRNIKFLRLNLNKSELEPELPVLAVETTEDMMVRRLQGLVHNQIGKRRVQYPKEFKLGVISYWRDMNANGVST